MIAKPKIITTEEINTLTPTLQVRRDELILTRDEAQERLNNVERIMKENQLLESKTNEQIIESVNIYLEEWRNMQEFYPDVRLGILQKTLDFLKADQKK